MEKTAKRNRSRSSSPSQAAREPSPVHSTPDLLPQNPPPEGFQTQEVRRESNAFAQNQSDSHHGAIRTKNVPVISEFHRGHGLSYNLPADGADTLFFDDSTNIQDLPEDLDWFFEESQSELVSSLDMSGTVHVAPPTTFQITATMPELLSNNHQPALPALPSYDNAWLIARSKILASLHSLPQELLESPFFQRSNLALFYDLYFKNYHHHFPILHQPSMLVAEAPPLLLTAIMTLGATLIADPVLYSIGTRVHDALRWIILSVSTENIIFSTTSNSYRLGNSSHRLHSGVYKRYSLCKLRGRCLQQLNTTKWLTYSMGQY